MASSNTVRYSGIKIAPQSDFRVGATVRENVIGVIPVRRSARLAEHREARVENAAVIPVSRSIVRPVRPSKVPTKLHLSPPAPAPHHNRPKRATGEKCDRALTQTLGLRAARKLSEIKLTARIVLKRCDQYIPPQLPAAARARKFEHDISRQETRTANPPTKSSSAENTREPSVAATRGKASTAEIRQIRILQLIMMRSKDVSGEVLELIGKKGLDVLLLQEPYIQKQAGSSTYSVKGLGVAMRIAAVRSEYPWAAVAACNPSIHITFISQLSNAHCACAEIRAAGFSFYVVSHYFQWSHEIKEHLSHLEKVLFALKGKRVLIGADTNANSSLWGPKGTKRNPRGKKLEKFT